MFSAYEHFAHDTTFRIDLVNSLTKVNVSKYLPLEVRIARGGAYRGLGKPLCGGDCHARNMARDHVPLPSNKRGLYIVRKAPAIDGHVSIHSQNSIYSNDVALHNIKWVTLLTIRVLRQGIPNHKIKE